MRFLHLYLMVEKLEKFNTQFMRKLKLASHWPVWDFSKGHDLTVKQFMSPEASPRVLFKALKNIYENVICVDTK